MKDYFKRLKEHPGINVGISITLLGFVAGAANKSFHEWYMGGLFGLICSAVIVWPIILISNIKRK